MERASETLSYHFLATFLSRDWQAHAAHANMDCLPALMQTAQLVVHTFRRSRRRGCEWRRLDIVLSSPVCCHAYRQLPAQNPAATSVQHCLMPCLGPEWGILRTCTKYMGDCATKFQAWLCWQADDSCHRMRHISQPFRTDYAFA